LQWSIEKTVAKVLPGTILRRYGGKYIYKDGQVDQVVLSNNTLLLLRDNNYMFELVPISETKFHIRGQVPYKYLTMDASGNRFVYFNRNENQRAINNSKNTLFNTIYRILTVRVAYFLVNFDL
jgi:hypothetical protein